MLCATGEDCFGAREGFQVDREGFQGAREGFHGAREGFQAASECFQAASVCFQEVSERLLTKLASILTKRPGLWHEVDEETRTQILEASQGSAKTEIMHYLEQQPDADVEELLIAIDQPELAEQMRRWAAQPLAIGDGALRAELTDLCSRYLQRVEANNRKETLQNLRESPNPDDFRRYWQQRKRDQD